MKNLEMLATDYFFRSSLPSELESLSPHPRIDDVYGIDVGEVHTLGERIYIKGNGVVSVELRHAEIMDQSEAITQSFPFDFEFVLELNSQKEFEIIKVKPKFDLSSYNS